METNQHRIAALEEQVNQLSQLMGAKFNEINAIRAELKQLKSGNPVGFSKQHDESIPKESQPEMLQSSSGFKVDHSGQRNVRNQQLETLIGTNIINKIGILVLVIGVYIGIKYAIDNQLISPLMRIILGYFVSMALAATALLLRKKYNDFSAVMMGGVIAITYFNTFVAHTFYHLMPQLAAFAMMLLTTVGTVWMAIHYNRKVIALVGQVGAYAIPFLLSNGNGNIAMLLAYVCIINLGLLYLSVKRDWKAVYLLAFAASWVIFLAVINGDESGKVGIALRGVLLTLHFMIFLSTFLVFKLIKKENYQLRDIIIMLLNALLYFAAGYMLIWDIQVQQSGFNRERDYLTVFAIVLGVMHLLIGFLVRRLKPVDGSVHLFLGGIGISFLTIAVPIAFEGNAITVLWATEAAIMAWIFHQYRRRLYHKMTVALLCITCISLIMDLYGQYFSKSYNPAVVTPFLNAPFLSCIFTGFCMVFITWLYYSNDTIAADEDGMAFHHYTGCIVFISFFLTGSFEIQWTFPFFTDRFQLFVPEATQSLSVLFYSQAYVLAWSLLNNKKLKSIQINDALLLVVSILMGITLYRGFNALADLRLFYLRFHKGSALGMLGIRYALFLMMGVLLSTFRKGQISLDIQGKSTRRFHLLLNIILLAILCNEFIHWMDVLGYPNQDKLGLSIIAGLYALTLVVLGILKNLKQQRISGIVLMGITLVKILFYDLAGMNNISRTLVLIAMGLILLAASYMYNRHLGKMKNDDN